VDRDRDRDPDPQQGAAAPTANMSAEDRTMTAPAAVSVEDLEFHAERLDARRAAEAYREHGCLVIRGLMKPYLPELVRDIEATARQSLGLLERAEKIVEGWRTPDGTLLHPGASQLPAR